MDPKSCLVVCKPIGSPSPRPRALRKPGPLVRVTFGHSLHPSSERTWHACSVLQDAIGQKEVVGRVPEGRRKLLGPKGGWFRRPSCIAFKELPTNPRRQPPHNYNCRNSSRFLNQPSPTHPAHTTR